MLQFLTNICKRAKIYTRAKNCAAFVCIICTLSFGFFAKCYAIAITPTRIDLNNTQTTQVITITNEDSKNVTYKIGYLCQKMEENGKYISCNESGNEKLIEMQRHINISRKEINIGFNETKKIKFKLNTNIALQKPEYNAHILFKEISQTTISQEQMEESAQHSLIEASPLFHIAIPIFLHKTMPHFKAEITQIKFDQKTKNCFFTIKNIGNSSPYGNLFIRFYENEKIVHKEILQGISITLPLKERAFNVKLSHEIENGVDEKVTASKITAIEVEYKASAEHSRQYVIGKKMVVL